MGINDIKRRAVPLAPPSTAPRVPQRAQEIRVPLGAQGMAEAIQQQGGVQLPSQQQQPAEPSEPEQPIEPEKKVFPEERDEAAAQAEEAKAMAILQALFQQRNEFLTEENKTAVESRCGQIDLSDILELSEVQQEVDIWPGILKVRFKTPSFWDMEQANALVKTDDHRDNWEALYRLTLSIYSINGTLLPGYRDSEGRFDSALFERRAKLLLQKPIEYLQLLDANYLWFRERLVKLMNEGMRVVKNG